MDTLGLASPTSTTQDRISASLAVFAFRETSQTTLFEAE
jgi:hypothetical protein